jgi:hypothetical protein
MYKRMRDGSGAGRDGSTQLSTAKQPNAAVATVFAAAGIVFCRGCMGLTSGNNDGIRSQCGAVKDLKRSRKLKGQ